MLRILLLMLILFLPSCAVAENKKMPPVNGFLESKAICLDYRYIEKTLTFNKETLRLSLLRSETEMIEIWAGRSRETWTIVLRSLTLTAEMELSDNGGDYENETGTNANDIQERARIRIAAYRKKGDNVSFNNQLNQGVQIISVEGNATITSTNT
jgi:hypothetical protein